MYVGIHMWQRHSNAIETIQLRQKKKKEWKKWLDIESLSGFLCLRYCRSLYGKIFASTFGVVWVPGAGTQTTFGGHLYHDTTNFVRVVNN